MDSLKVFLVFAAIIGCVLADKGLLPQPCDLGDMDCWSKSTQSFLEKTCKGIPEYDIRPIDPLLRTSLDCNIDEELGLVFHLKNLNITGLKNQKISEFKMDVNKMTVLLKTRVDALNIASDIVIEFSKKSKSFSGTFSALANTIGTAQYSYTIRKDDKGVEFIDVGPETITCEAVGEPNVTLDSGLGQTLLNDTDAKAQKPKYEANRVEYRQKLICKIVESAYVDVVHNIRASAKILPKSAFFKNL